MSSGLNKLNSGFTEQLFEDLNCRFDRGWISIVGPNGSGRTSLINLKSKEQLLSALLGYKGFGIIVNHERSFLDKLPYQTLFIESPFWDLRAQAFKKPQRETVYKDLKIKKPAAHYRNLANTAVN